MCWNVASIGWLWLEKVIQHSNASFGLDHWKVVVPLPTTGPTLPPGITLEIVLAVLLWWWRKT